MLIYPGTILKGRAGDLKQVVITFASAPSSPTITKAPLRFFKSHALTIEQDDNIDDVYQSIMPLLTGGFPELEPEYESPGRFVSDNFGGLITMKGNSTSWCRGNDESQVYWEVHLSNKMWDTYLPEFYAKGFGVVDHHYWYNMDNKTPEQLYNSSRLYNEWIESKIGIGTRPFSQVKGGSTEFLPEQWFAGGFAEGRLIVQESSGGTYQPIDITVDTSALTGPLITGRFTIDNKTESVLQGVIDQLMAEANLRLVKMGGHMIDMDPSHTYYPALKAMYDYIESTYAAGLWVPSMNELVQYLHTRDRVVINQELIDNTLTLTFDTSAIPFYVRQRGFTFKVTSDVVVQSINVENYIHRKKGIGTMEATIDVEL